VELVISDDKTWQEWEKYGFSQAQKNPFFFRVASASRNPHIKGFPE
jgi:hypothetical protein